MYNILLHRSTLSLQHFLYFLVLPHGHKLFTPQFLNKMLINLEEFRADMYGVEPEEQYLHPVECRTYNKKIA